MSDNMIDPAGGGGDLQFELDAPRGSTEVAQAPSLRAGSAVILTLLMLGVGLLSAVAPLAACCLTHAGGQ